MNRTGGVARDAEIRDNQLSDASSHGSDVLRSLRRCPLGLQAFAALRSSPGARAYYDQIRARGTSHRAALRQLGNRLVGILHGCLKARTPYDEDIAWAHHSEDRQAAA